ncbi:MAG: hypothetical protein DRP71_00840 [Verrucomicrobia bacterium]|nr:MAG: hypothetical protein DRP71_00840 [Verrucomicrobiota bacterium]
MKLKTRILILTLGSAIGCSPFTAAGEATDSSSSTTTFEFTEDTDLEMVTFLGVEVREVDPVLLDHLDLDEGIGLVVEMVTEDSPASRAGLRENDILVRMGDQLLVTPRQFTVLVRREDEGAKVNLEILRKGKRSKVQAVLEKREVPVRKAFFWMGDGHRPHINVPFPAPDTAHLKAVIMREMRHAPPPPYGIAGAKRITHIDPHRNMVFTDDDGTVEMTLGEHGRKVVVKDSEGIVIYDGDGISDEGLPDEVMERIRKLEIHLDGDLDTLPHPPEFDVMKAPGSPAI